MGLIPRPCRKIRILGSSAQSKEVEIGGRYLVFHPKSILLSRSPRFGVAPYSNTACLLEHFGIFVSVDDEA